MVAPLTADDLTDRERMDAWVAEYEKALPADVYTIALEMDRERHVYRLQISWLSHGIAESVVLG